MYLIFQLMKTLILHKNTNLFSKILNFASINIGILVFKMFFFSAYFSIAGTQNIPPSIFEFAQHQYSHDERSKKRRQTIIDDCDILIVDKPEGSISEAITEFSRKLLFLLKFNFQIFQGSRTSSSALNQTFKNSLADLFSQLHYRSFLVNGKLLI